MLAHLLHICQKCAMPAEVASRSIPIFTIKGCSITIPIPHAWKNLKYDSTSGIRIAHHVFLPLTVFGRIVGHLLVLFPNWACMMVGEHCTGLHVQKVYSSLSTSCHNAYTKFFCWLLMYTCILIAISPIWWTTINIGICRDNSPIFCSSLVYALGTGRT